MSGAAIRATTWWAGVAGCAVSTLTPTSRRRDVGGVHMMLLFQWQDGKKVIVWPEELAPGKPRFPTPPWRQRQ